MKVVNVEYDLPLALELLHDVEEVIVDLRLVIELVFDLVQIGQCVLHLQALELRPAPRA